MLCCVNGKNGKEIEEKQPKGLVEATKERCCRKRRVLSKWMGEILQWRATYEDGDSRQRMSCICLHQRHIQRAWMIEFQAFQFSSRINFFLCWPFYHFRRSNLFRRTQDVLGSNTLEKLICDLIEHGNFLGREELGLVWEGLGREGLGQSEKWG